MSKPKKPYPEFPLFAHGIGQWAKKIKGTIRYFGAWADPDKALVKYLAEVDHWQAGNNPRLNKEGDALGDLVNVFLESKKAKIGTKLTARTWSDYYKACSSLIGFFGRGRYISGLKPADFDRYYNHLAKTKGTVSMRNAVLRTKIFFNWLADNKHIKQPVEFGTDFVMPSAKELREAKTGRGKQMFGAEDLRAIIESAGVPMKAMILLGANVGFGQTDIASLPLSAIDLGAGVINFPRVKTAVARRAFLWPETIKALDAAIAKRPQPLDESDKDLAFLTIQGRRWIRHAEKKVEQVEGQEPAGGGIYFNDYIGSEFNKLVKSLGLKSKGIGFYGLRHSFRTAADGARDREACDRIMGHTDSSMAGRYIEEFDDERLRAVANVVHAWLWPDAKVKGKASSKPAARRSRGSILPFKAAAAG